MSLDNLSNSLEWLFTFFFFLKEKSTPVLPWYNQCSAGFYFLLAKIVS